MNVLVMAWRNLFRQKRLTLIALSSLMIGMAALVVFQGYIAQTMRGFRNNTIHEGIGHVQIAAQAKYFEEGEFNASGYDLPNAEKLTERLQGTSDVVSVFGSTGFTAIAGYGEKSTTLLVKGYPIGKAIWKSVESYEDGKFHLGRLISGREISAPNELILGETAARILKTKNGDVVTLMAILPDGGLEGRDFTVVGIYKSPGKDKVFAFTDVVSAMELIHQASPPVLHVFLKNDDSLLKNAELEPYAVKTWPELATFYVQVNTMFFNFLGVIRTILILIVLFILANTMNRIVFERMREWGTLRALGTKKISIISLVVAEGTFLGIVGTTIGILFGFLICLVVNLAGGVPFRTADETFLIRLSPDDQSIWANLIWVSATAAVSTIFPARRAVKMTPSECLRQI